MAEIFPDAGLKLPADVDQLLTFCTKLPADWRVYVGWSELAAQMPDALIVTPSKRVAVMSASSGSSALLDTWSPSLSPEALAKLPLRRLNRAINSLAELEEAAYPRLLILTRVKARELSTFFTLALPSGIRCETLDTFSPEKCQEVIEQSEPCSPQTLKHLRALIRSPVQIQPKLIAASLEADRQVRFLDRFQEQWLRRYLAPPVEPETTLPTVPDAQLVTGIAGSGKTLLLLYRAGLELKQNPALRVLFVTHNKGLTHALNRKAETLSEQLGSPHFRVQRFFSWCSSWVKPWRDLVQYRSRDEIVKTVLAKLDSIESFRFYEQEFDWIRGEGITTEEKYLEVERHGRVRPLQPSQRRRVWAAYAQYCDHLNQTGKDDWLGAANLACRLSSEGKSPLYDLILIDEAQLFAPVSIRTLRHALTTNGRMVIAADPTQGFAQRKTPWSATGFDFRSRSIRLKIPYRCSRRTLEFAKAFYEARPVADSAPEVNLPNDAELAQAELGEHPEIVLVERSQNEISAARSLISRLIQTGVSPDEIFVLHHSSYDLTGPSDKTWKTISANTDSRLNAVRTATFEAGTGLECPYVIVLGLRMLLEPEEDPTLAADLSQYVNDNTRKVYVAFTRAGFRLIVTWSGPARPNWFAYARVLEDQKFAGV